MEVQNEKGLIIYDSSGAYSGWMGNCMFQLAATIGTAIKNGMPYAVPIKDYWKYFNGKINVKEGLSSLTTIDYTEKNWHYDEIIFEDKTKNYNLLGYYQSRKYWEHCQDEIRKVFDFNDEIKKHSRNKAVALGLEGAYLISIHVRRGDYLLHPKNHPVLPVEYYVEGAKKIFAELLKKNGQYWFDNHQIKFVVCSDDIDWCKENFTNESVFRNKIVFSEGDTQEKDMCLLSMGNSHIIANSTLSYWSSYLSSDNNKIIIAPKKDKWFGSAYAHWDLKDMYCDEWICI